jgi:general secretion pathway protein C
VRRRLDALIDSAPTIVLLALLVLGGWLAARWFWYFATPAESPPVPHSNRMQIGAAAQTVADAHLFGVAPAGRRGEVVSNLNVKLKGVFASGNDAPAFAIVNTGGRDEPARAGREVVPGVVLESVHATHVMLRRDGALERVNLEERAAAGPAVAMRPPPPRAVPQSPAAVPTPPPVPTQPAPNARLQRQEPFAPVGDAGTQPPEQVAAPAPPPVAASAPQQPTPTQGATRGLVVQSIPPGSALERFGIQPGDVIRSVNGEPVNSEADLARIVQSRGLQGPYTAEVVRGGQTIRSP